MKIGDRVKVISTKNLYKSEVKVGDTGKVIDIEEMCGSFYISVECDRDINGHSCDGKGKNGRCIILRRTHLEKI